MKTLLIFIIWYIRNVNCDPGTEPHAPEFQDLINPCLNDLDSMNLHYEVNSLGTGNITKDVFIHNVHNKCNRWLNTTLCNVDFSSLDVQCQTRYETQINAFRLVYHTSVYFCQNETKNFLETIENDGAVCTATHTEYNECLTALKIKFASQPRVQFKNDNVCEYLQDEWQCNQFLKSCDNTNLLHIVNGAFEYVKSKFLCV